MRSSEKSERSKNAKKIKKTFLAGIPCIIAMKTECHHTYNMKYEQQAFEKHKALEKTAKRL